MKKRLIFITAVFLFAAVESSFAAKIMNDNVSVRTRPGAFYPVVTVLSSGVDVEIVQDGEKWKRIITPGNNTGWISANAFNPVEKSIDYGAMAKDHSGRNISRLMVTAAVKGFFESKTELPSINQGVFDRPFRQYVYPQAYLAFKKETFRKRWSQKKFQRENYISQKGAFSIDENSVALSTYIAAKFSAPGLSGNNRLVTYVNHVAQLVLESTEFYDLPVCVLIVESNKIFANSTPMGVIVVSKGMLKMIRDESELACLLGHEIAHIALGHGATEFEIRKPKFAADGAFSELADELGVDEVEKELDDLCNDMYERSIRGRKFEYEKEADYRGMIYARRAGYSADGMERLLKRLKTKIRASRNPEDTSHWLPSTMQRRISIIEKITTSELEPDKHYQSFQARFQKYAR